MSIAKISEYILPVLVAVIVGFGAVKGIRVFDTFIEGAKEGLMTVYRITAPLVALIAAVNMLKASGGLDIICSLLSPAANLAGIPREIIPLTVLSPVSGSGSVAMFESILKECGPDSFAGRCASVIMGSTETTFYAVTLYFGAVNIKKTRHTLPCAVCADLLSYILSPIAVALFLPNR